MAPTTTTVADEAKVASIKTLTGAELNSVPSEFTYIKDPNDQADASDPEHSIPTIDFAQLTTSSPDLRSKAIQEIGRACEEWGFFQV